MFYKPKKNQTAANKGGNRLLISITVLGSAGPIQFVVSEDELFATVIDTALKSYARKGRLSVLRFNLNDFFLYCYGSLRNRVLTIGAVCGKGLCFGIDGWLREFLCHF